MAELTRADEGVAFALLPRLGHIEHGDVPCVTISFFIITTLLEASVSP